MSTRTTMFRSARRLVLAALVLLSAVALGQDKASNETVSTDTSAAPKTPRKAAQAALPAFSPAREAAALSFVKQHHAELAKVLEPLKKANAAEYEKAVRELFRTSERLAGIKERDERRYAIELDTWKANSRIRLLAARLSMSSDNAQVEKELRQAIQDQIDLRISLQELDRQEAETRLQKIDANLARLKQQRDDQAERTLKQILNSAKAARSRKNPGGNSPGISSGGAGAENKQPAKSGNVTPPDKKQGGADAPSKKGLDL
ncbi:MAG: hypothetical protein HYS13_13160 [Planctomycetia bacterium]|nr:hypothetical protein [Planctomycetia bacterium]